MSENTNQPKEYDAVLGGQNPPPINAAVLGGIEGVKKRLASSILEVRINALSDAIKYGDQGLDLVLPALQDESIEVQFAAYSLLKDRQEPQVKQQLGNCLPFFEFEVVTVDASGRINSRCRHYARYFTEDLGNGVGLEMVAIPGGTQIGSLSDLKSDDIQYRVTHYEATELTINPFFMGKYPITQEQWQAVMGDNPSHFKGAKRPVENVSLTAAYDFCHKLREKTGKSYALPSNLQRLYACRAGTTTPFHFGETITPDLVNYNGNYPYGSAPKGLYRQETTPVGSFPPNAFGLYDMHGNVCEWSNESYTFYHYRDTDYYIMYGGSWLNTAESCGSASTDQIEGDYAWSDRRDHRGFRVCWFG